MKNITVSIVSHGQLQLVQNLLSDLESCDLSAVTIVLTLNIPEDELVLSRFKAFDIKVVRNSCPMGFGANHNQAFHLTNNEYFVIINPDIRFDNLSFDLLCDLFKTRSIGAVAPLVRSPSGRLEDSARKFPTVGSLIKRVSGFGRRFEYPLGHSVINIDWAAGMFVVYRSLAFREVGGFDVRYFMYMEDADICRRLKAVGWQTVLLPSINVVHDARRNSHRNMRHMMWHLASAFRFLFLSGWR